MVFHVIRLHVPGPFGPQQLLAFREQHAKESEHGQDGQTAARQRERRRDVNQRVRV